MLVDGGVENFNSAVDDVIASGILKRVLAQTEIDFSKSPDRSLVARSEASVVVLEHTRHRRERWEAHRPLRENSRGKLQNVVRNSRARLGCAANGSKTTPITFELNLDDQPENHQKENAVVLGLNDPRSSAEEAPLAYGPRRSPRRRKRRPGGRRPVLRRALP